MKKKVGYSCFVDSKPKFEKEVVRWLWSLLENLNVDPSDIYITCDPGVSSGVVEFFRSFCGLNVNFEPCFTVSSQPANKWLQLKSLCAEAESYSHFVVTDCDKVFVEFSEEWCDDSIRACKFIPRPTFAIFESVFEKHFSCQPRFTVEKPDPHDEFRDGRSYVNNHNGGLIILPTPKLKLMTDEWKKYIDQLLDSPEILKKNLRNLDQVAFAMAMHSTESDINFLPATLDLGPNISAISEHVLKPGSGQLILHIHGQDQDDGQIICGEKTPENYQALVASINDSFVRWSASYIAGADVVRQASGG